MLLDFFPSRALTWYLAKTFIVRILAVLLMLVLVLQMLDLLSQSGKVLAYEGNGEAELLQYVSLRFPQLVSRFLPYSVLLATIITLAGLSQNSEVVAMKATGLSAHQILAPLFLTAVVISGASFVFNDRIVTRASTTLKAWEKADYGPVSLEEVARSNIYLSSGTSILQAGKFEGTGNDTVLRDVTYYERDKQGMIQRQLRADTAVFANPGWQLQDPRIFTVRTTAEYEAADPVLVGEDISVAQLTKRKVDPDAETLFQLRDSIAEMEAAGQRVDELKAKWWHKISGPLSAILMPLLGAVAGFGLARSGKLFARALVGMGLGFAYFVVDNAALAMGGFGGYPPLLAAWAPFFLFFLIGETVLIRTEE